jgi:predicted TIM-barrel fold metal-dependent hydrolase
MGIVDSHVHLYPPDVNRDPAGWARSAQEPHWAALCTRRRRGGRAVQAFPSVDELLAAMDAAGVERAVLLGWYWENPDTAARQNRFYAECVRAHPDRLAAFATFHPRAGREAVVTEIRRAEAAGLGGIGELSPHAQGYAMDDPVFREALALAAELRLPVNLHVTDPESRAYPGRVETPLAELVQLARATPGVNFILSHWGGLLPLRETGAAAQANLYYDSAASPLIYDAGVWRKFLAVVPAERVLFGSDFPLNLYPRLDAEAAMTRLVAEVRTSGLEPAQLEAVLSGTARRLFNR